MTVHRVRIALDTDIPEHRAIWEQISGLSTHGRLQFLRTHLYRSVKALADGAVVAATEIAPSATVEARAPVAPEPAPRLAPQQATTATPQSSASTGRKLQPFLGGTQ